ncbi:FAD-dependent pyridine nucleotide-disulfide oxidoreductase [Candidatus Ruthia magnifica str. Cm (Calyptogena magnifica)]|uniref:FAD-dependent pyridine nucleotide-disulfide oxidoreductase n=1 Tax=Ruthia magnifica subsp. Calyptogena magnifica TaxID=413404 RepID=A1AX86_RUTMC|nr:FAD-dependent oxidoreductase [Candidatus Ruthturnera calyptogenae]ABL02543.1 FAD-dependent pyridine nucleotide-disulfide oxidoreductase [Candidatus Ruthia magnifica str. Cm (Calyptogena magnifica)]
MKKIIIIGSGFAGLTAVRTLRKNDKHVQITLISPKAELIYMPSLIWIPSDIVSKKDIVISLERFFKRMNVRHIASEVTGLSNHARTVITSTDDYENDALIIASGGQFLKKLPGIEHVITPCEGLSAVEQIRDKIQAMDSGNIAIGFASNPKELSAMRGGPMFEFLFGLDTQLRQEGRRDKFNLIFFTSTKKPGARLGERAVKSLLNEMKKRKIKTYLGHKMKAFEVDKVITEGSEFATDLILFMPGMTGNEWFDNTELERSEGGLLKADKFCQVQGGDRVFVAGDSGSFSGPEWMPKQAHMADLQATAAAKNVLEVLNNNSPSHTFKIELMCIIDSNNKGMYISRTLKGGLMLPNCRLMHYAKQIFGWWYLRQYRN